MEISRREIARYLGYRREQPDPSVSGLIEDCIGELTRECSPKSVHQIFPLQTDGSAHIRIGTMDFISEQLARNLRACDQVILFAATLGSAADTAVRRASLRDMSRSVVMQAAAAAMIEAYCNDVQDEIRGEMLSRGLYLRPRFSPGYGDCPLSLQKDITRMLDTSRRIGLTLTEDHLLVPMKSVTAFIGLSSSELSCHKQGCEICTKTDCAFRLD